MDSSAALTGLARVSGLLVSEHDPLDAVTLGVIEACQQAGADAGGVLVAGDETLEVLAATSHATADLEVYQAGVEDGPCVESVRTREAVSVESPEEAEHRWPGFGVRMSAAGYVRALAVPMVWQGGGVGGLNLFWRESGALGDQERVALQAFADILTIAVVHVRPVELVEAVERLQDALATRAVVEQAKGVLAWRLDIDTVDAYLALLDLARERGVGVREAARSVIDQAAGGHRS